MADGDGARGATARGVRAILNGNAAIEASATGETTSGSADTELAVSGDGEEVSSYKNLCTGFVFILSKIAYITIVLYNFFGLRFQRIVLLICPLFLNILCITSI